VTLAVVAATIFNVTRVLKYSHSDTELATRASQDEVRAADLRREAARLRATVDPRQIEFASNEAREANELIDRRTFSWTELLNQFEQTLPDEVRITAVRPRVGPNGDIVLTISVIARSHSEVEKFIDNLDATGQFPNSRPTEERVNDEGLYETTIDAPYLPSADGPESAPGAAKP
jgi:hypothetical protein